MRFDAYCGNVRGLFAEQAAEVIAHACRARLERGRGRGRYSDVFEVKDGAQVLGWVGTDRNLSAAFFEFKGSTTPSAVQAIRKHWPREHTVSRLDTCEDYDDPRAYRRLVGLIDHDMDPRVKSKEIAPRRGHADGRTTYWGSRQSVAYVRVYEAGKMPDRVHFGRPNWCRAEAEMKPQRSLLKVAAAQLSPVEAWGLAGWSQKVGERLCQVEVPRLTIEQPPPSFDRTTVYLARAFRKHWAGMLEDFGDWECIGRELEAVWASDDAAAVAVAHAKGAGDV